jgi:hypothetical protein
LRDRVRDARDKIADAVLECFHNDVEMPAPIQVACFDYDKLKAEYDG